MKNKFFNQKKTKNNWKPANAYGPPNAHFTWRQTRGRVSGYFVGDFVVDDVARSQPRKKEKEILLRPTWTNQVLNGLRSHVSPPGICLDSGPYYKPKGPHSVAIIFLLYPLVLFFTSPILLNDPKTFVFLCFCDIVPYTIR